MSDDSGRGYPGDDPFVDADDPEAVARAERRRERESKRASKRGKQAAREPAPAPPPPKPEPPAAPRTPEQEFWDEPAEPTPPAAPSAPVPDREPSEPPKAKARRGGLLGRLRSESAPSNPAPAPEASETKAPPTGSGESPTGEQPSIDLSSPPTEETAAIEPDGPPTAEQPMPRESEYPDDQPPIPSGPGGAFDAAGPPTTESRLPDEELERAGRRLPDEDLAPAGSVSGPTAESTRPDRGSETAESPRPGPNRGGAAAIPAADDGPSTREHRAPVPRPVEQAGAGDWEPPPPRDDDWFDTDEEDFHDEGDPTMAGAARTGRRHGDDGGKRGPLRRIFGHPFLIVAALIAIFILIIANGLFQPFHGDGHGKVAVRIPKGSSVGEVGDLLERRGVISGGTLFVSGSTMFQARVTLAGKRSDLLPGRYALQEDMSYGDAIDRLTSEPASAAAAANVTVTIPEGYTRTQVAQLAREDGLRGSYIKATRKSKYLNPARYGGKGAKNLEGFLFPDTWELKSHSPVANLVQLQLQDFRKKIKQVNMKYARSKNLTVFDVLTIASIIEHEAGTADQRKLVANVVYNRLREGMTLGSDATTRFAVGNFDKPLTQSQLESNSPYNTRVHPGLPPGPISNPGLAAIDAAAHPARKNYLFFVTSPDCKRLNFSATEAEFEEDVQKYEDSKCTE